MTAQNPKAIVINTHLADNFKEFGERVEMPVNVDSNGLHGVIGIDVGQPKPLVAHYQFDPSGTSYTAGAVVATVNNESQKINVLNTVLTSPAVPQITER